MAGRDKRVVVLGGCGNVGEVTVRRLAKSRFFSEIVIADKNIEKADKLAAELGTSQARAEEIDASDHDALIRLMKRADVVINEMGPFFLYGAKAVRAAIEAGVNYVDINDDADVIRELFDSAEFDRAAKEANMAVIVGLGTSPGLSNLAAKYAAQQLDRVDEIHIRLIGNPNTWTAVNWGHRLHVFSGEVTTFKGGRWVGVPAFGDKETVHFFDGNGHADCYNIGHPEPITLPRYFKSVQEVSVKMGYSALCNTLALQSAIALGLSSSEPISVKGQTVVPVDFIAAWLSTDIADTIFKFRETPGVSRREVRVKGELAGKAVAICIRQQGGAGREMTGMPPQMAAEMLASGAITAKGLLGPEVVDPKPFLEELAPMLGAVQVVREEVSSRLV